MAWKVELTEPAASALRASTDRRQRSALARAIDRLAAAPDALGKPLVGELRGLRSLRVGRFRVIYRVDPGAERVVVIAVGIRREGEVRDVYELARRLVRLLLEERSGMDPDAPGIT